MKISGVKYIAVEGAIGVGKTSLVHLLCRRFDAQPVLEQPDENPFLDKFYRDRQKYAFQTQLAFLFNRYQQQKEIMQLNLFHPVTISDYLFEKDRIFAYINLDEHELIIYERVYNMLKDSIPKPDLVIFLQADLDALLARVRHRNRKIDKNIDKTYLNQVNKSYNRFFFHYDRSPLVVVKTTDIDFVNKEEDLENLIHIINNAKKGTHYYSPLGSP
ncbi:MAG: deoxyadenosine kinase [Candidatus Schekmanbacteria bacterium RBG_13_48_7]|uniref:Deoxyadenosine kinase n=1 Tax=Candidatus Schekmanbacteria bacterium RBG_13_48_7 TaxID=1817878 RepID=A0A1F7RR39_9BACT|nr:MAG: deoxyadenosine kinase [Candidatus Schekmanbacteria bacterium RBG_13_48_7]